MSEQPQLQTRERCPNRFRCYEYHPLICDDQQFLICDTYLQVQRYLENASKLPRRTMEQFELGAIR